MASASPTPTLAPTPTPTPTNSSYRPSAVGDSFAYAGTLVETFVRPPQTAQPLPSPNPPNTQTLAYGVTQSVAVLAPPTAGPFASATYDVRTLETDVLNGGLRTMTSTTDSYVSYAASGASTIVRALGTNVATSDGATYATTFGSGNGLIDVLPEVAGPVLPSNNAALAFVENDPSTASTQRTTNADGTYAESLKFADGTSGNGTVNADGSATYVVPRTIGATYTITFGAPTPQPSSAAIVPITIALSTSTAPPAKLYVAAWYPQPVALASDALVDNGDASVPAACNVSSKFPQTGHQLVETKSTVDPIFGELDAQTVVTYTSPGVGVVCVQLNDIVTQYYDYSGQSGMRLTFSSTPVQTTTTTQTLGITQATVLGLTARERHVAVGRAFARATVARFDAFLARERAIRRARYTHAFVTSGVRP